MQSALRSISIERPRRVALALGAMALALGMAWSVPSSAQSSQRPTNVAPVQNQAVTPKTPGAVQDQSKAASQQGTEQKADEAKDKAKDKAKKASP